MRQSEIRKYPQNPEYPKRDNIITKTINLLKGTWDSVNGTKARQETERRTAVTIVTHTEADPNPSEKKTEEKKKQWKDLNRTGEYQQLNEDAVAQGENWMGVFDGIGGLAGGDLASSLAAEIIKKRFDAIDPTLPAEIIRAAMKAAFDEANAAIIAKAGKEGGMGTTAAVVFVRKNADGSKEAIIAHIGDSRVVLRRKGRLIPMTIDDNDAIYNRNTVEERYALQTKLGYVREQKDYDFLYDFEKVAYKYRAGVNKSLGHKTNCVVNIQPPIALVEGDELYCYSDAFSDNYSESGMNQLIGAHIAEPNIAKAMVEEAKKLMMSKDPAKEGPNVGIKTDDIAFAGMKVGPKPEIQMSVEKKKEIFDIDKIKYGDRFVVNVQTGFEDDEVSAKNDWFVREITRDKKGKVTSVTLLSFLSGQSVLYHGEYLKELVPFDIETKLKKSTNITELIDAVKDISFLQDERLQYLKADALIAAIVRYDDDPTQDNLSKIPSIYGLRDKVAEFIFPIPNVPGS